ncbi:hypothetical protein OC846_001787 [Tilletia horrida]|uniref:Uncharacterized protein n=1 Tax=Tilletia horrida TaxID=155126 RepID=A0AAN6GSK5_9BASI|nr:hypothetical protein OC845_001853 [Tilletia horrida]KAK0555274.1 hypothetical protein OC846_001787 [Tilletia horrida]
MQPADQRRPALASERVWNTPELVLLILQHLVRERLDVISVSLVSKALRSLALSLLVRALDIPLSRLDSYQALFDNHRHLGQHVRFVRIYDDQANIRFCHRPHSRPLSRSRSRANLSTAAASTHLEEVEGQPDDAAAISSYDRWLQVKDFVKGRWPNARFDITTGIKSIEAVSAALLQPGVQQNVVAIRCVADHSQATVHPDEELFPTNAWNHVRSAYSRDWERLSKIIRDIILAQMDSDIKLLSIQVEEHQCDNRVEGASMYSFFGGVATIPQNCIRTISLHTSDLLEWYPNEKTIFQNRWPRLKNLTIDIGPESIDNTLAREIGPLVNEWLSTQSLLQHLDIYEPTEMSPLKSDHEFPNLTSISLRGCKASTIGALLSRLGHQLIELELPELVTGFDLRTAIRRELVLPNLRTLRASPATVAAVIDGRSGPRLAQIEFKPVLVFQELMKESWILFGSEAAHTITCLDIEIQQQRLVDALPSMSFTIFKSERFPSLVEISLCSTYADNSASSFDAIQHLTHILETAQPLSSLRALRIEEMTLRPFPTNGPIEIQTVHAPSQLEYLTWHSPTFNRTQYFRVIHRRLQDLGTKTTSSEAPQFSLEMQHLPASFRVHISEEGEWVQPGKLRYANIIFDHTVSPPRLRPQP